MYIKLVDDIRTFWHSLIAGIHNLIIWIPVIWKDRQWDYYYLLYLERKKLSLMEKHFKTSKVRYEGQERDTELISLAIKLIDIILEDDSAVEMVIEGKSHIVWDQYIVSEPSEYINTKYINIRNAYRFIRNKVELSFLTDSAIKTSLPLYKDNLRIEKAIYIYNKLRTYNLTSFWI